MGEQTIDEIKGRTKEAAGALTDDEELKREGKIDQASSTLKDKAEQAAEKAKDLVSDAADKAKELVGRSDDDLPRR
jgi:uncharacterized protein YjbJ (UPF0337 family)